MVVIFVVAVFCPCPPPTLILKAAGRGGADKRGARGTMVATGSRRLWPCAASVERPGHDAPHDKAPPRAKAPCTGVARRERAARTDAYRFPEWMDVNPLRIALKGGSGETGAGDRSVMTEKFPKRSDSGCGDGGCSRGM